MRSNKSRDTKPELAVRRAIHALGLRYRVCARPLPAVRRTVDVVFRRDQVAVEVRGCFWHGCAEHYRGPSTNGGYWAAKVARNIARDTDTERRLHEAGWTLLVVWEHENPQSAALRVRDVLSTRRRSAVPAGRTGMAPAGTAVGRDELSGAPCR
ncbi:MAG: mismatch endonuclease, patch repair protein [Pseudonocardiales bacterium]|jgi:DNA mismatch endonuclease (patch repair protein)|nr:mismatch endonuclease, patch repair protein [Pseudonocardiales bacterium]